MADVISHNQVITQPSAQTLNQRSGVSFQETTAVSHLWAADKREGYMTDENRILKNVPSLRYSLVCPAILLIDQRVSVNLKEKVVISVLLPVTC